MLLSCLMDSWGTRVSGAEISSESELLLQNQCFGGKDSWNWGWDFVWLGPEILMLMNFFHLNFYIIT